MVKFVTRAHARVDRIACAWLIRRFIDANAEILYVADDEVMAVAEREDAIPFDMPGVELGHHGPECSFDAFLDAYQVDDPALRELARIVRGADTEDRGLTPESAGLFAIASGFRALSPSRFGDDHALLEMESPVYDALYEHCQRRIGAAG